MKEITIQLTPNVSVEFSSDSKHVEVKVGENIYSVRASLFKAGESGGFKNRAIIKVLGYVMARCIIRHESDIVVSRLREAIQSFSAPIDQ